MHHVHQIGKKARGYGHFSGCGQCALHVHLMYIACRNTASTGGFGPLAVAVCGGGDAQNSAFDGFSAECTLVVSRFSTL